MKTAKSRLLFNEGKPTLLIVIILMNIDSLCLAQDKAAIYLKSANTISRSHVKWHRFLLQASEPVESANARIEREIAKSKQAGRSDGNVEKMERNFAKISTTGFQHIATKEFTFDGVRVVGDAVHFGFSAYKSKEMPSKSRSLLGRFVDYFDGENSVNMQVKGSNYPDMGVVSRDSKMFLKFTASNLFRPQFLFGQNFDESFAVGASVVEDNPDDVLIKKIFSEGQYQGRTGFLRISKIYKRPSEFFFSSTVDGVKKIHIRTDDWKQFGEIWFPQDIVYDLAPARNKKSPKDMVESYKIISASFNADADMTALNDPVRPGTFLNDHRFAPRIGVRYKVRHQLPPNATVLQMVEKREVEEEEIANQQKLSTARNIALPSGALFLVGGLAWFRRLRRDKT